MTVSDYNTSENQDYKVPVMVKDKVWGREIIFSPIGAEYTGKILEFQKGASSSSHFHLKKFESFFCLSGKFEITFIKDGVKTKSNAGPGDRYDILPGLVHKVKCIEPGWILEASTRDYQSDSYRLDKSSER